MSAKRPRVEVARSVLRLVADKELVPLAELVDLAGVSEQSLTRWAVEGKGGRYLDAVHRPGRGWLSSRAALARFQAADGKRAG